MPGSLPAPRVSVALICDFDAGEERGWEHLRSSLRAVATQDFDEPVEVLLVESGSLVSEMPPDVKDVIPDLRLVAGPEGGSYELKNEAARQATTELLVLLDADCIPERDWLRRLVEGLRAHPEAVVLSAKTEYAGRSRTERILSLLSRSYLDPGRFGETRFISNNNAIFRREAMLAHPLPEGVGPFGSRAQSEAFRREGRPMLFEPRTRVVHDFEGWETERDIRRNFGYGAVRLRQFDPRIPHSWLLRLGRLSIPLFLGLRTLDSFWNVLRLGPAYGVPRRQLPLALGCAVVVHALEIGGMLSAFRGDPPPPSSFR